MTTDEFQAGVEGRVTFPTQQSILSVLGCSLPSVLGLCPYDDLQAMSRRRSGREEAAWRAPLGANRESGPYRGGKAWVADLVDCGSSPMRHKRAPAPNRLLHSAVRGAPLEPPVARGPRSLSLTLEGPLVLWLLKMPLVG